MDLTEKLEILSGAARYDASCASSGPGNPGVCHAWADDGRCVSLLKVLFTNVCLYDCAYCANRRCNAFPRASFTVEELVGLSVDFWKRNYVEGLFLSSGVFGTPDETMEALVAVARALRSRNDFRGYLHLKAIPGADPALIRAAGLYADRLSVNLELPSRESLASLAPEKSPEAIFAPMRQISAEMRVPQSTQLIVGASPETDLDILRLSAKLYEGYRLKRVYYSAYIPVNRDNRLPALAGPPLKREHRLYQSDWLYRFYGFAPDELAEPARPYLDPNLDPKAAWALRHPEAFPVDVNRSPGARLLRVPGLGPRSVERILRGRRSGRLRREDLRALGAVVRKAEPFLRFEGEGVGPRYTDDELWRRLADPAARREDPAQLRLFP